MNERPKKLWLDLLATSKQTTNALYNVEEGAYCCLGALTQCYINETGETWNTISNQTGDNYGWQSILSVEVVKWAGLTDKDPYLAVEGDDGSLELQCMTHLNDDGGYTFQQLAELIEAQL